MAKPGAARSRTCVFLSRSMRAPAVEATPPAGQQEKLAGLCQCHFFGDCGTHAARCAGRRVMRSRWCSPRSIAADVVQNRNGSTRQTLSCQAEHDWCHRPNSGSNRRGAVDPTSHLLGPTGHDGGSTTKKNPARRSTAKMLTKDEAWRIAALRAGCNLPYVISKVPWE